MKTRRYAFIKGEEMKEILEHVFGASKDEFRELENACDNLNHDPYLKSRKVTMYRLGIDLQLGTGK